MLRTYSFLLPTFSEGVWFVLALGFISCGSSVPKHPLVYNEQLISNFTTSDDLETSSGEVTDTVTKQTPPELSTEEFINNHNNDYPDGHITTQTDLPETTQLLLYNSTSDDFFMTQYNVTDNSSSSEGFKMVPVSSSAFNTGIIIGISLLVVIVAVLVGAISYILYRHNMWNRPQTLSDKCSNDESTGYIDDTFRENSEEMYSLDNDSFLNSLEAMTIQNYWTDHVKHTKL